MSVTAKVLNRKKSVRKKVRNREIRHSIPIPSGARVEIQRVTGREPELVRHRALLEAVCGVEFPYPKERFAGRGVVICGGGAKYLPSVYVLVRVSRRRSDS